MGRIGVTASEVELIAERLLQQGDVPTIERIRQFLGTGSNSTISKYLNEWKKHRLKASIDILPPLKTPSDPVNEAVKKVWQQLQADSESKTQEIEAAAKAKIEEALLEKENALSERDKFIEDNQNLRNLLKEERIQNAELEKAMIELRKDYAYGQGQLEVSARAHEEFKELSSNTVNEFFVEIKAFKNQVIPQYEKQIEDLKANYERQLSDIKEHAENMRHKWIVDIDALKTTNEKLTQQLEEREAVIKNFEKSITELKEKFTGLLSELIKSQHTIQQEQVNFKVDLQNSVEALINQNHESALKMLNFISAEVKEQKSALLRKVDKIRDMINESTAKA